MVVLLALSDVVQILELLCFVFGLLYVLMFKLTILSLASGYASQSLSLEIGRVTAATASSIIIP